MQMFPIPPWLMNQVEPMRQSYPHQQILVPPRVQRAMDFLSMLDAKTMKRPVANDISIEIVEGSRLSGEELVAQGEALKLLSLYFAGQLKPDDWELPALAGHASKPLGEPGRVIVCPMCPMQPQSECPLCHGNGRILVVGAAPVTGPTAE